MSWNGEPRECKKLKFIRNSLMHDRFRWVECQLQELRRCRNIGAVNRALTQLPETLDKTYDRILNNINGHENREMARCVLNLLAVCHYPLKVSEVAAVMVVDCESKVVDENRQLLDP